MSTGADNKTMPITAEYADGYDRTFGKPSGERGTFVYDKRQGKCVPLFEEYQPDEPAQALSAPIMSGRFYENAKTVEGHDIGSRRKHREYMKERGLTTADDFTETWAKAERERENMRKGVFPDAKERRNEIGRILYEVEKKGRKNGR
jgi:hypothetical protein